MGLNLKLMTKYKVKANKQQLSSIGIGYEITDLVGVLKDKYITGWYAIEITYTCDAGTFTRVFDIPKTFLTKLKG